MNFTLIENGVCDGLNCVCFPSFIGDVCEYEQVWKSTVLIWHCMPVLGQLGAAQFYLGFYIIGGVKLALVPMVSLFAAAITRGEEEATMIAFYLAIAVLVVWWVVDTILISYNKNKDINGIEFYY